ncbi:endospore germination permease [Mycoplasmatota bacterium]|nr:endospore germination permease [Mycoplasmatota bacterium]
MLDKVRISSFQLALLIIGYILGSATIFNPAFIVASDSWMVVIFSSISGIVLIGIYCYISILNPGKTLIDILISVFGKTLGTVIGFLYIWYFIHLFSLIGDSFIDFNATAVYVETPALFFAVVFGLVTIYRVKKGLEVIARFSEIVIPLMISFTLLIVFALIGEYDVNYFFPVLENGFKPVLKASFFMMTFPFGELVVFLMIFPHLNRQKNIFKISSVSVIIASFLLLLLTISTIMVIGPAMIGRITYPSFISAKFVPEINIEVLTSINLLIGGAIQFSVLLYATCMGISQILKLDDYKPFIIPVIIIAYALSFWLFENTFEHTVWSEKVFPYYSLPFQVFIPLYILIFSIIKNKMKSSN